MPLPVPEPGLVVSYEFLWASEAAQGLTEGRKAQPCVIVAVNPQPRQDDVWVAVVPVTHSPPADADMAVELTQPLKHHLRLDAERSWVVLAEYNYFIWPGFDLRQIPGRPGDYAYGQLPRSFYRTLIDRFRLCVSRTVATARR
jgi:hypothetical protein